MITIKCCKLAGEVCVLNQHNGCQSTYKFLEFAQMRIYFPKVLNENLLWQYSHRTYYKFGVSLGSPIINLGTLRVNQASLRKHIMKHSLPRTSSFHVLQCLIDVIQFYYARKNFLNFFQKYCYFPQKIVNIHFPFLNVSIYAFPLHIFHMHF